MRQSISVGGNGGNLISRGDLARVRRTILARRGEAALLAREIGISHTSLCQVLRGRSRSARILAAAIVRAAELEARA